MKRTLGYLLYFLLPSQLIAMAYLPAFRTSATAFSLAQRRFCTQTAPIITTQSRLYSSQATPKLGNIITISQPWYKKTFAALLAGLGLYSFFQSHTQAQAQENEPAANRFIRPPRVQESCDEAFKYNTDAGPGSWLYGGRNTSYDLLSIYDEKLIAHLAASGKKDIYIMDVGAGEGAWARYILQLLQQDNVRSLPVKFHIFSITGGSECEQKVFEQENAILYQLNQFKIENIDEELQKRGFNLENKIDLVVSNWTLRHLTDPFGTVEKIYNLLAPDGGKFLSNGFLFKLEEDSTEVKGFPYQVAETDSIATQSNASMIFRHWDNGRDAGQFLLMRTNNKPLELPLQYTGGIESLNGGRHDWQCMAGVITEFRQTAANIYSPSEHYAYRHERTRVHERLYCLHGDDKCEQLYDFLVSNGLFEEPKFDSTTKQYLIV